MKRRTFLARLARTPVLGSVGYLTTQTSAHGSDVHVTATALQAQGAKNATPLPRIDARSAALLVMDYQPAWI